MPPQRQSCAPEQPEVAGCIAVSDAAFVFLKAGFVQTLMRAVLDVPVLAFEAE